MRHSRAKAVKRSSDELCRSVSPYCACLFSRLAVCALLETSALHCSNPITAHILHHVAFALRAPLAHHTRTPARAAAALYDLTRLIYLLMFPDVLSCTERACREGSRLGLQVAARPASWAGALVEHRLCGSLRSPHTHSGASVGRTGYAHPVLSAQRRRFPTRRPFRSARSLAVVAYVWYR